MIGDRIAWIELDFNDETLLCLARQNGEERCPDVGRSGYLYETLDNLEIRAFGLFIRSRFKMSHMGKKGISKHVPCEKS